MQSNVPQMVAKGIQLPKGIINGIAQDSDRLIGLAWFGSEDVYQVVNTQRSYGRIFHHQAQIIPIGEVIVDGIGIDDGGQKQNDTDCDSDELPPCKTMN
jgi:hypothetical protein